jgi:transcription antitermination factor NusG
MPLLEWFAIRVKSNREKVTALGLQGKGYEVFLPEYQREKTTGKNRETAVLFPGYLFSRFDSGNRLPILTLPGVLHIVGVGKTPLPVDASEVESLKLVIGAGLSLNTNEPYTVGEKVLIEEGPLSGAWGVVVGHKSDRLIVSISLLQRSVSVVIDPEWIGWRERRATAEFAYRGAA